MTVKDLRTIYRLGEQMTDLAVVNEVLETETKMIIDNGVSDDPEMTDQRIDWFRDLLILKATLDGSR